MLLALQNSIKAGFFSASEEDLTENMEECGKGDWGSFSPNTKSNMGKKWTHGEILPLEGPMIDDDLVKSLFKRHPAAKAGVKNLLK